LAALDVVFDKPLSDGRRAHVFVEAMGRLTRCEVGLDRLQPAEA
jgi:hypothetical protein